MAVDGTLFPGPGGQGFSGNTTNFGKHGTRHTPESRTEIFDDAHGADDFPGNEKRVAAVHRVESLPTRRQPWMKGSSLERAGRLQKWPHQKTTKKQSETYPAVKEADGGVGFGGHGRHKGEKAGVTTDVVLLIRGDTG